VLDPDKVSALEDEDDNGQLRNLISSHAGEFHLFLPVTQLVQLEISPVYFVSFDTQTLFRRGWWSTPYFAALSLAQEAFTHPNEGPRDFCITHRYSRSE
jgi:hypothetical protein